LENIGILLGLVFILIVVLVIRRMRSSPALDDRLLTYAGLPEFTRRRGSGHSRSWLVRLRLRLNTVFSGLSSEEMNLQLMSANWPITPVEYMLLRYLGVVVLFVIGWLVASNILVGIGLAILVYMIPNFMLRHSANRRRRAFEKQLVDVLVLITGAVRAGFSLMQAMEVVMRELAAPVSEEFRRVLQEVNLGRPVTTALLNMGRRMANKDLDLLVTAIQIQYTVGGNLTTMLEAVTETIRERIRLYSEVRAITSQQRLAATIIASLPIFVIGAMFVINPGYISGLFQRQYVLIPIIGGTLVIIGFFVVRRMARIDV
jgi:tight adherence protein B